jgi:hypothetical protein
MRRNGRAAQAVTVRLLNELDRETVYADMLAYIEGHIEHKKDDRS